VFDGKANNSLRPEGSMHSKPVDKKGQKTRLTCEHAVDRTLQFNLHLTKLLKLMGDLFQDSLLWSPNKSLN